MDPNLAILYHCPNDTTWYSAASIQLDSRQKTRLENRPTFSRNDITEISPPEQGAIIPVTIDPEQSDTIIEPTQYSFNLHIPSTTPPQENANLKDYLWSNQFYKRLIGPLQPPYGEGSLIAESIRDGSLLACCDGSYSPLTKLSSHGWVIANQTTVFWNGAGAVEGHKHLTGAYRAELGGFVSILHLLTSIYTFHQNTEGSTIIYGDCLSAINKLKRKSYGSLNDYLVANFDLLNEDRLLLDKLKTNISVTLHWVKGHSTGNKKSWPHILNNIAHNLANDSLHKDMDYYNPSTIVIDPPSLEASILYNNSTITSNMATILR